MFLMRINLPRQHPVRNSWCSTKITNDDGHHFVAPKSIAAAAAPRGRRCVIAVTGQVFFLVVLRPVSHSPLENAPFLLGTKTDLLRSAIQQAQQHGSRDHKSFVALLYRSGAVIYNVCK